MKFIICLSILFFSFLSVAEEFLNSSTIMHKNGIKILAGEKRGETVTLYKKTKINPKLILYAVTPKGLIETTRSKTGLIKACGGDIDGDGYKVPDHSAPFLVLSKDKKVSLTWYPALKLKKHKCLNKEAKNNFS